MKSKFPEKKVMTRYFCVAAVFVIAGIAILGMTAKICSWNMPIGKKWGCVL